ncbi:MAG: protein kinase, partial [Ancalomicrobiaceae bacterium]|nr:protein kinase [Ancalomicrobiaceae bacterium]
MSDNGDNQRSERPISDQRSDALPAGTRVRDYEIVRVLGQGGFGITYEALHTALGRRVAIKEFFIKGYSRRQPDGTVVVTTTPGRSDMTEDLRQRLFDRFLAEARKVATKFRHPHIVRGEDFFATNGAAYFVMELIEGQSFDKWVAQYEATIGPLSEQVLRPMLEPVFDAVEYIHGNDEVHRDLKPHNIMIRNDGSPVLIDFGAARTGVGQSNETSVVMMSGGYSPPEQINNDGTSQYGRFTDIYSLGAILYRLVSGATPPEAMRRLYGLHFGQGGGDPCKSALEAVRHPELFSPRFLAAIDKALRLDARERHQTIAELKRDLGWDMGDTTVVAPMRPQPTGSTGLARSATTAQLPPGASSTTRSQTTGQPPHAPPDQWPPGHAAAPIATPPPGRPKRSGGAVIAAVAAVVLLLAGGAAAAWLFWPAITPQGATISQPDAATCQAEAARIAPFVSANAGAELAALKPSVRCEQSRRLIQAALDQIDQQQRAEAARLAELAKQADVARKAEEARQADLARQQAEAAKQAEEARQAELARQQADAAKQAEQVRQAELARQQADAAKQAEQVRQAELARQQAEAAKQAEQARQAELARQQADAAKQAEQVRQAELARQQAEAAKQAEQARQAELARQQAEAAKQAEQVRQAELARQQAEAAKQAEQARQAELARQQADAAKQAEQVRQAELARQQAEAAKQAEQVRQAELARQQADAAKQAEQVRQAELARQQAEAAKQAEDAKKAEEARRQQEAHNRCMLDIIDAIAHNNGVALDLVAADPACSAERGQVDEARARLKPNTPQIAAVEPPKTNPPAEPPQGSAPPPINAADVQR